MPEEILRRRPQHGRRLAATRNSLSERRKYPPSSAGVGARASDVEPGDR